jgi:hypothetical protein
MSKYLLVNFLLLLCSSLYAQNKSGYTQIFGGGGMYVKFNGDTTYPITGQQFSNFGYIFWNATSNICDSATGQLKFICNGSILYDTLGSIMENGDSLQPHNIYDLTCCPSSPPITQGSLILPKGSNGEYYVFVSTISDAKFTYWYTNPFGDGRFPYDLLLYNVVDMNANGGLGKVMQKNIPLLTNVELNKVGMMACRHANGYDWWLLKQGANTNTIYTFLVTKDTILLDAIQSYPLPIFGYYDRYGQSCFNTTGTKYAFASGGGFANTKGARLFIADFDRCYGILSNVKEINVPYDSTGTILDSLWNSYDSLITGVCFSPNDSFLYVNRRYNIYQYELNNPDSISAWYLVKHGPDTAALNFAEYGQLQIGIDQRVYVGKIGGIWSQNSVINKPNLKGAACDFCRKCLRYDVSGEPSTSLANMPDFNLGALQYPCPPLSQSESVRAESDWSFYPNPANETIIIQNATGKKKVLYSALGEAILSTIKNELDVSRLPKGVYYLYCENQAKKVVVE